MRKWIWTLSFIGLLFISRLEHTGADIRDLEPVELVFVSVDENRVRVETDTGAKGSGEGLEEAVQNLHNTTPATVFLDTAEYLVLTKTAQEYLPQLCKLLRPACRVCIGEDGIDPEEAEKYLRIHPPENNLLRWTASKDQLQKLSLQEGRGYLEG